MNEGGDVFYTYTEAELHKGEAKCVSSKDSFFFLYIIVHFL